MVRAEELVMGAQGMVGWELTLKGTRMRRSTVGVTNLIILTFR
jgi:hypothetical protein